MMLGKVFIGIVIGFRFVREIVNVVSSYVVFVIGLEFM